MDIPWYFWQSVENVVLLRCPTCLRGQQPWVLILTHCFSTPPRKCIKETHTDNAVLSQRMVATSHSITLIYTRKILLWVVVQSMWVAHANTYVPNIKKKREREREKTDQWDWRCPNKSPSEGAAEDLHKPRWYWLTRTWRQFF